MFPKTFNDAFEKFLDRGEFEQIKNEMLVMVSTAFIAGWSAAGGKLPEMDPPLSVYLALLKEESD